VAAEVAAPEHLDHVALLAAVVVAVVVQDLVLVPMAVLAQVVVQVAG
jgi:hypothetical protein